MDMSDSFHGYPFRIASKLQALCNVQDRFSGHRGLCLKENHYVSFYPEGRMDLYAALEISDTCDLCGRCDYQCCFVTGMRSTVVMSALKLFIADHFIGAHTHERRPYRPRQNEENSFWRTVMVCHN